VLHDHDGDFASSRRVERLADLGDRKVAGRVLDRKEPVEVLLLCVDDDHRSAWCASWLGPLHSWTLDVHDDDRGRRS
jgi:hypothetical protein